MSILRRLKNTLTGHSANDELSAHLELAVEDLMAQGMSEAEARREANRRFGAQARLREETRDAGVLVWLDGLLRDFRFAARSLRRHPGLFWTAVLSLGIGIGACCTIFAVADAALFASLPVEGADRLVTVAEFRDGRPSGGNAPRMRDWGTAISSFESIMGIYGEGPTLLGRGDPRRVEVARLFGDPLTVLRAQPALGRAFDENERRGRGEAVALITDRFWRKEFNGQPSAIGAVLNLSGAAVTVIGVMPATFLYPPDLDVLLPAPADLQEGGRGAGYLYVAGRLKPGATLAAAQSQAQAAAAALSSQYPETDRGLTVQLRPMGEDLGQKSKEPVLAALAAVLLVLLIACVNIASLLMARAAERQRESAIRAALGAGQASLVRLHLAESAVLAIAGAGLGLAIAWLGLDYIKRELIFDVHRLAEASIDGRVALFCLALACLSVAVFGVLPSFEAARVRLAQAIGDGARGTGRRKQRGRAALVVLQVGLSAVLLSGAGQIVRSLMLMRQAPLGFSAGQVYTLRADFPWDTPRTRLAHFIRDTEAAVRAIPGVRSVGVMDRLPLAGGTQTRKIAEIRGKVLPPAAQAIEVSVRGVTPGIFAALSVPLISGDWLSDRQPARHVMVNSSFARTMFGSPGEAIGREFRYETRGGTVEWWTISGVVGDIRQSPSDTRQPLQVMTRMDEVYWPMLAIVVLADGQPGAIRSAVRAAAQRSAPDQVLGRDGSLDDEVERSFGEPKLLAGLFAGFALVALALSLIGLVGVLAGEVTSRRREIGIRLALGAIPGKVANGFAWRGFRLTLAGLAAGLFASVPVSGLLANLLFGIAPNDALSVAAASVLLLVCGAAAAYLTSLQAVRVDPVECLRQE